MKRSSSARALSFASLPAAARNLDRGDLDRNDHDRNDLRQKIKALLDEASFHSSDQRFCHHCGKEIDFMDVTVTLYGTEARWHVRLPVCPCTSNNGPKTKTEADHQLRKGVASTTDENYPSNEN